MNRRRRRLLGLSAALLAAPALAARAQSGPWPTRGSIRLVATFPPGGLADTIGRLVAPALGAALGQSVLIDNRAGAGGTIGADMVAKSPPDGYSLVISHASPHGFAPGIYPQLPYDPVADFTHLGMLVDTPSALLVTGRSPFRTLDELLAAARRGSVRYGSSGVGSSGHLLGRGAGQGRGGAAARPRALPRQRAGAAGPDGGRHREPDRPAHHQHGHAARRHAPRARRDHRAPDAGAARGAVLRGAGPAAPHRGRVDRPVRPARPARADRRADHRRDPRVLARPDLRQRFDELASFPPEPPLLGADYARYVADFAKLWTGVAREANITAS